MKIHFNVRYFGIVIILTSITTAFTTFNLSNDMLSLVDEVGVGSCSSVGTCPHVLVLNYSYIFYAISLLLLVIGILMLFFEEQPKIVETKKRDWDKKSNELKGDEKTIYDIIKNSDGIIYQSKLTENSGMTKVKVSRILDSLETKNLLERRRRGMSNTVVLK